MRRSCWLVASPWRLAAIVARSWPVAGARRSRQARAAAPASGSPRIALALATSRRCICALYEAGGARYGLDWAVLAGDRQGRVRPRSRSRSLLHAAGRRQRGRRRWPDAVPRVDLGALRRGRRRRRQGRPWDAGRRDLSRRPTTCGLGRAGRLPAGDLRLQPRRLVRRRGRRLGRAATARRRARTQDPRASRAARSKARDRRAAGRRHRRRCASSPASARSARSGRRARRADPRRRTAECRRWWSPATSCRTCRTALPGIPTHGAPPKRTARAPSTTCSTARACVRSRKSCARTRWPRTMSTGACPGPGRWVTIYATDEPTASRVRRHRGPAPGHQPRRHGRRPQSRRGRPALAHPRSHPHVGALVGPPSAGVVGWRACPTRRGRLPADRRRPRCGQLRALAARGGRRGGDRARRPRARRALQPPGVLEGLPARRGVPGGATVPPRRLVGRAEHRADDAHQRDGAGPRHAHGKLSSKEEIEFDQALIATGANVRRLNVDGLRARADPLPAHARQRRRDPRGRRRRRAGRADRRLLHRLRGRGLADRDRQALHDRDAGAGDPRTGLRRPGRTLLPGAARRAWRDGPRRGRARALRGRRDGSRRSSRAAASSSRPKPSLSAPGSPPTCSSRSARASRSASAGVCAAPRGWRARPRASTPRGTSASTTRSSTAAQPVRIEHWDVAFNHGKTAAMNMLGRDMPHEEVPYFYSVLADWGELEYVGPAYEWDEEIVRGSFDEGKFTVWYLKGRVVKAALTFGRSEDLDHARRLIDGRARARRRPARCARRRGRGPRGRVAVAIAGFAGQRRVPSRRCRRRAPQIRSRRGSARARR